MWTKARNGPSGATGESAIDTAAASSAPTMIDSAMPNSGALAAVTGSAPRARSTASCGASNRIARPTNKVIYRQHFPPASRADSIRSFPEDKSAMKA